MISGVLIDVCSRESVVILLEYSDCLVEYCVVLCCTVLICIMGLRRQSSFE